jgi:hypothetical protein
VRSDEITLESRPGLYLASSPFGEESQVRVSFGDLLVGPLLLGHVFLSQVNETFGESGVDRWIALQNLPDVQLFNLFRLFWRFRDRSSVVSLLEDVRRVVTLSVIEQVYAPPELRLE